MIPSDYGTSTLTNGNNPDNLHNMITDYGTMNLEDLTKYEINFFGKNIKRYQYNQALFKFSMYRISADSKKSIMVWPTQLKVV